MRKLARAFLAFGLISAATATPLLRRARKFGAAAAREAGGQAETGRMGVGPEIAPEGPVLVYVDLGRQRATVYRNGVRIGVSTISSGKDGYETPTGVFTILEKDKDHRSRTYDDAPMPYQQRLTWKGVAMHAGNLPGFPASHGCVRLPMEFAKKLFDVTPMGGTVVIAGGHEDPVKRPAAGVLAPAMAGVTAAPRCRSRATGTFTWTPDAVADRPGLDHHFDRRPAGGDPAQRHRDRPRPGGRPAADDRDPGDDLAGGHRSRSGSRSALPISRRTGRDHQHRARRADAPAREPS